MSTWYAPTPGTAAHHARTVVRAALAAAVGAAWIVAHILIPC